MLPKLEYTSEVQKTVWKTIKCQYCGCEFAYEMTRIGKGSGTSALFLENAKAEKEASQSAYGDLQQKLSNEFDNRPCPECGKYQDYMVDALKAKKSGRELFVKVYPVIAIAIFIAFLYWGTGIVHSVFGDHWVLDLILYIVIIIIVYALVNTILKLVYSNYNPNARVEASKRSGMPYSWFYPVMRRNEYEKMADQMKQGEATQFEFPSFE